MLKLKRCKSIHNLGRKLKMLKVEHSLSSPAFWKNTDMSMLFMRWSTHQRKKDLKNLATITNKLGKMHRPDTQISEKKHAGK